MAIKVIRKKNTTAFEDECNILISNGYELKESFITPDFGLVGIFQNGAIELQAQSAKLDKELVKENTDLNKQIDDLKNLVEVKEKELDLLEANFTDMQEKYSSAISDGEGITDEINTLKTQLDESISDNTILTESLNTCKKECTSLKASNTKLKKKIEVLIEAEE